MFDGDGVVHADNICSLRCRSSPIPCTLLSGLSRIGSPPRYVAPKETAARAGRRGLRCVLPIRAWNGDRARTGYAKKGMATSSRTTVKTAHPLNVPSASCQRDCDERRAARAHRGKARVLVQQTRDLRIRVLLQGPRWDVEGSGSPTSPVRARWAANEGRACAHDTRERQVGSTRSDTHPTSSCQ